MELYVLDGELNRVGMIDVYESLIWNTAYNAIGTFELRCSLKHFNLLLCDRFIQNTIDDLHNGVIEQIQKIQNEEGAESLLVKGRMLEVILDRRVACGGYTFESVEPAQIVSTLVTQNAIAPSDMSRKIPYLEIGVLANADEGTVYYGGTNESLLTVTQNTCIAAQLGHRLYIDDEKRKIKLDIYKGVNRTSEDNTLSSIEVQPILDILNGDFNSLDGWEQVDGGTNYAGQPILKAEGGLFKKIKIMDRYAEYWETTGLFRRWVYFYRKAGHVHKNLNLNVNHVYYIKVCCKNPSENVMSFGIQDDKGGYSFDFEQSRDFVAKSIMYVPKTEGDVFACAKGELPDVEGLTVETEYCYMVDLTATFGAGLEPDLLWCDHNIYYDGGLKYKIEILSFVPNQNDPLVFSRDRDTLIEVDYTKAITNESTVMYVGGDGLNTIVYSREEAEGLERKESCIDLSGELPRERDGVLLPEASYIAMLKNKAFATLRKLTVNELVDGVFYVLSNKRFRRDFDLGDLVTCTDHTIGFETNLRITSALESWGVNGYTLSVTLGEEVPDITETIKLVAKGAKTV